METHFASPQRSTPDEISQELQLLTGHPMLEGIMITVEGLVAVANKNRQVVSVNTTLLESLGVHDPESILGLRPGEILQCVHSHETPGGCGTTEFCATCGAAIAMVTCFGSREIVEKYCVMEVEAESAVENLYLKVRACPLTIGEHQFTLLFLLDVSAEQQWASMERVFFHDINNILNGLTFAANLIETEEDPEEIKKYAGVIKHLANRLAKEIGMQRALSKAKKFSYNVELSEFSLQGILKEVQGIAATHKAAAGKYFTLMDDCPDLDISSDHCLLLRVLFNMLINAFEASEEGEEVHFGIFAQKNTILFKTWNKRQIPEEVTKRIFQKNFSTKDGTGRGLGTFSMKFFGEKYLGGKVGFSTSRQEGTTFTFALPVQQGASC